MNCEEAKKIDIVEYMSSLGFQPKKIKGNDYWFLSPFRNEKEASFKVNKKFNVWYDHGLGKGGNLIDFGILFYKVSVTEFLDKLGQNNFFFHQHIENISQKNNAGEKEKISVIDVRPGITFLPLANYLQTRKIPLRIADSFCKEIDFRLYDKKHTAIGFKNKAGGYELRNEYFKGSSSPKDITLLTANSSKEILVFEGFFNFLSWQTIQQKNILLPNLQPNLLVLNSLSFFEKAKEIIDKYSSIHLYLDRDNSGMKITKEALSISNKYIDESYKYKNHKDLNEFLMKEYKMETPTQRIGRRL
ncbi:MAG TPA: toprim domain-containing protein [Chitinophagaceae bacterium]